MAGVSHDLVERIRGLVLDASARSRPRAEAAAAELTALRDALRALDLPALDHELRRDPYELAWSGIVAADLRRIAALPNGSAVVQMLTCHGSGYVREAAVQRLAVVSDHADVAFLLLRVNDWVRPVRRAACDALRARTRSELARALVPALPLLERMRRWGRIDEPEVLDDLDATLGPADLAAGLASPDVMVRRICARRLVERELDDPAIDRALDDRDPVVRRAIASWLCRAAGPRFDARASRLLSDPMASIRRDALAVALSRGGAAEAHLEDPDAATRRLAQAHLVARGDDVAARYRRALAGTSARSRAIALIGLVEIAGDAVAPAVREGFADPEPRVRGAALAASAALRVPDLNEILFGALADPAPMPRRAARDLLVARAVRVPAAAIWTAFRSAPRGHGQRASLVVLARCDFWPRLSYLLRATAVPIRRSRSSRGCRSRSGSTAVPACSRFRRAAMSPRSSTPSSWRGSRRRWPTRSRGWQPRLPPRRRPLRDAPDHPARRVVDLTNATPSRRRQPPRAVASVVQRAAAWLIREPCSSPARPASSVRR